MAQNGTPLCRPNLAIELITHCVTAARRRAPRTNKIFLHYLLEHAWPYHNGSYGSYGGVSTTGCSYNQAAVSAHLQVGWCRDAAAMKIIYFSVLFFSFILIFYSARVRARS